MWLFVHALALCVCLVSVAKCEQQEVKYRVLDTPQSVNAGHNNAWMVVAIIFIVLFVLLAGLCIYLCYMRHKRMQELYDAQNMAKIRHQEYISHRSAYEGRHYM